MQYWPQIVIGFFIAVQVLSKALEVIKENPDTLSRVGGIAGVCSYWIVFVVVLGFGGFWSN